MCLRCWIARAVLSFQVRYSPPTHGANVPFAKPLIIHRIRTVQRGKHPNAPISALTKGKLPFRMAPIESPRYPVWLSTVWVALSIALLFDGHPVTAFLPLFFWFLHRRWELS